MSDQDASLFQGMLESTPPKGTGAVSDQGTRTQEPSKVPAVNEMLSEIKNERGEPKYKTVEDAIAALKASQEHISTLETENQEFKGKLQEAMTIEQLKEHLNSTKNTSDDNQQSISMEDIQNLVSHTLEEKENVKRATDNQRTVVSELTQKYGDKAEELYNKKAQDLGLNVEDLNMLAARAPKAVLQYFDIAHKSGKNITGSVNTESFQKHNTTEPPKTVMYGASTSDLVASWKASAAMDE